MRKATFAKLSLTAAVGLGTLFGLSATAEAGPPMPGGMIAQPTTTTTPPKPQVQVQGDLVNPEPDTCHQWQANCEIAPPPKDPQPPFDPDLPLGTEEQDECNQWQANCDLEQVPEEPEPECKPWLVSCDEEITSDPGCTWTHGCPEEEPECHELQASCDLTSDGGTDGGDEGTDDGGDESTTGGDESTTGGSTDGGSGGSLPRTGAELATWAIAGIGLTGAGAALRKLGKRAA